MWFRDPIPKNVREVLDALEKLPRTARKLGGPEGLCGAFAALVDHTLLKPEATPDDVRRVCDEAAKYGFAAVFVNPCYVALAAKSLEGSGVCAASVAGFPLGAARPDVKRMEAELALSDGAREVDMVIRVGALKAGDNALVEEDIRALADVCHQHQAILKVILECAVLNEKEKRRGAKLAVRAGADFVKTSTGFGPGGATPEDVALLRDVVGRGAGVKAAGGIRTLAVTAQMLAAGASRIGTSSGVGILEELRRLAGGSR
ncbi:MAG TPA: deoxyribose-phosphate aldolase [Candidatus Acidoferrales bacterium]|nr:deoxyribose-phosphate aldolase [Candidatus Acidoferrales bacterium]